MWAGRTLILAVRVAGASLSVGVSGLAPGCASDPHPPVVVPDDPGEPPGGPKAGGSAWRDRVTAARAFETALGRAGADPRGALAELDRAIAADPEHALARVHAAELRLELSEELPHADADLARAMVLLPDSPRAHLRAGQVAHALSDDTRAEKLLTRAATLKPDWADPQIALIDVLVRLGRAADAVGAATRARELAPERLDVATRLADTLSAAGRPADAAREMEVTAARFGRAAPLYRRAATLWDEAGSAADAARVRALADKLDPPPKPKKKRALPPARKR